MPPVYPSGDIDREAAARQRGGCGALLLAQKKANRKSQFAFGPFLCIGIAIAMFFGETIADWYMGLL